MDIRIRYQRRDEATPRVLELSPEEYFDPLDPGETLSVRSVPRLLDTYQYTPHPAEELRWTIVEITDGATFWRVRTQFLDGMRALMHHSQESDGSEEIIHQSELCSGCWHTIRTLKEAGKTWTVVMDSLTVERPVHLDESRDCCESWSFEDLQRFGDVR
jgi:hypothetical protein